MKGVSALAEQLAKGDRRALARAITLVESTRPDHRRAATELLAGLEPRGPPALRLGMTGTPGVGKSSLIERLGLTLADEGHSDRRLCGRSVVGAFGRLDSRRQDPDGKAGARANNVFIRPSPSQSELGGVGRRTREDIALVEAGARTWYSSKRSGSASPRPSSPK